MEDDVEQDLLERLSDDYCFIENYQESDQTDDTDEDTDFRPSKGRPKGSRKSRDKNRPTLKRRKVTSTSKIKRSSRPSVSSSVSDDPNDHGSSVSGSEFSTSSNFNQYTVKRKLPSKIPVHHKTATKPMGGDQIPKTVIFDKRRKPPEIDYAIVCEQGKYVVKKITDQTDSSNCVHE